MLKISVDYIVYHLLAISSQTHLGKALNFFLYDTVKIFFLLSVIIFLVAIIRSCFPPERTRRILSRKQEYVGNGLAGLLGIVTPFCSCSAVPLFIGFVESGVPLGVTFSFLVSSPMINEVALVLLLGLFGWRIAIIYIGTGLIVSFISGIVIGKLKMEKYVQDYVYQTKVGNAETGKQNFREKVEYAKDYTRDLLRRIWPYVLAGVGVGGFIHGYVPSDFLLKYAGPGNPLAVPVAVLIGVPLYSNAAGTIPIVQALMGKGMPIGTVLAFMMAVTALSFPEAVILKNVLKIRLLLIFFGTVAAAIVGVGYLFNSIL
jgi:uncharacterized membrane protein YraQ (UPF0718 family)